MNFPLTAQLSSPTDRDASWPTQPENAAVLHVSGEVDLLTAPVLRNRLREASSGERGLLVDLSAVTFMDCAGLAPLLEARRELGTRLCLRGLPDPLLTILRVCRLQSAFTILDATDTPAADEQARREDGALPHPRASHREPGGHLVACAPAQSTPAEALSGGDEPAGTIWRVGASGHGGAVASSQRALIEGGEPCDRRTALDLQEAMTSSAVVEQAKGLLMGTLGCDVDDAWQLLLSVCRAYRVRVGDLAAVLVGDADGTFVGIADPPLMDALRAVLAAHDARASVSQ